MEIITYHKQNKFQSELLRLVNIFKPNWKQINKVRDTGLDVYNIGPTIREKVGVTLIIVSMVVPVVLPAPAVIPLSYRYLLGGRK